jgi:hypothetical protein
MTQGFCLSICINVWGTFCKKCVRAKSYTYTCIHTQCVNGGTGISFPHSRACPLIGSFLLGFTYCDGIERDSDKNIIFRCSFIGYYFLRFYILTTGNVFLCLTMIQNRKNIKTLGNGLRPSYKYGSLCFDALSITYSIYFFAYFH